MTFRDESLGFLLADVSRLMRCEFQRRLEGDGNLTLAQAKALIYLSRHEGIRQVELAEILEVQPITLARLLDGLAEQGLVERRRDPLDGRAYHLYLTEAASPQLAAIKRVAMASRAAALSGVSKEESAVLARLLKTMRDNLASR